MPDAGDVLVRHSFLLALVVLVPVAVGPAAAVHTIAPSPRLGWPVLAPPESHQAAEPTRTAIRTRSAASFLAAIPAALLLVLYLYRRRPYLIAWGGAWVLLALMLYTITVSADWAREGALRASANLLGAARVLGLGGVFLICLAIRWFHAQRISRGSVAVAAGAAICVLVSAEMLGLRATLTSSYVALAAMYAAGAALYLRTWQRGRLTGALAIGVGMLGAALTYGYALWLVGRGFTAIEPPNLASFVSVAWHALIALGMHLMVFEDMSAELHATNIDLEHARLELEAAAITDPLTGCYNRRFFDEVADHELQRHRRHRLPLSLLFVDCNHLKAVNDTLGHAAGDHVLQLTGRLICEHIRWSDYVFRWGGDEFLVMLSCDEQQAHIKAAAIEKTFAANEVMRVLPTGVGLSIGCVAVPADTDDLLPVIRAADERMYANKARAM